MTSFDSSAVSTEPGLDRLFLHFFDTHFLKEKELRATPHVLDEMRRATRLAVASANRVFVPVASYFESEPCRQVLAELSEFVRLGNIVLLGSSPSLDEFIRERVDGSFYKKGSSQNDAYKKGRKQKLVLPYSRRSRSATRDIVDYWNQKVTSDCLPRLIRDAAGGPIPEIERRLQCVPEELGTLAFIPEHVFEILSLRIRDRVIKVRLRDVINEGYFGSYVQDLDAGVVVDLSYLSSGADIPSCGRNLSYTKMVRFLQSTGRFREFESCEPFKLISFGVEPAWKAALHTAVSYPKKEHRNTVLCVTAANVEFKSVHEYLEAMLGSGSTVRLANKSLSVVRFDDTQADTVWYLAQLSFQGQTAAAATVTALQYELHPDLVLMVGMCMGMPKRRLAAGTVIVPNEVVSFDHQRVTSEGSIFRPHGRPVDNAAYKIASMEASVAKWDFAIVSDKGLASASVKIESVDSALVKAIESQFPDAAAFDMEGSGFYAAADGFDALWIKAVADSGEAQGSDSKSRGDKQETQAAVTLNAAALAYRVARRYFESIWVERRSGRNAPI